MCQSRLFEYKIKEKFWLKPGLTYFKIEKKYVILFKEKLSLLFSLEVKKLPLQSNNSQKPVKNELT